MKRLVERLERIQTRITFVCIAALIVFVSLQILVRLLLKSWDASGDRRYSGAKSRIRLSEMASPPARHSVSGFPLRSPWDSSEPALP